MNLHKNAYKIDQVPSPETSIVCDGIQSKENPESKFPNMPKSLQIISKESIDFKVFPPLTNAQHFIIAFTCATQLFEVAKKKKKATTKNYCIRQGLVQMWTSNFTMRDAPCQLEETLLIPRSNIAILKMRKTIQI